MQTTNENLINRVFNWNKERGLLEAPYNQTKEASFIAEELTELLTAKESVDMLDAHIDSVIFQIGAISKIVGSQERAIKAFDIVLTANEQKSNKKNDNGKVIKDDSFIEPTVALKNLLRES